MTGGRVLQEMGRAGCIRMRRRYAALAKPLKIEILKFLQTLLDILLDKKIFLELYFL